MRAFIICLSLVAFLTGSCSKEDTDKKIDFYKNQARDENIFGKWKTDFEDGDYIISNYLNNGEIMGIYYYTKSKSEEENPIAYYYTKDKVFYKLVVGTKFKVADREEKYDYKISDNVLYFYLDGKLASKAYKVK